jgi:eukaryotic-like serine/threonine-protein kinase
MNELDSHLTVDDLLGRWQLLHEQGKFATVEDLCTDCPEKTAGLRERLRVIASMMSFLGIAAESGAIGSVSTEKIALDRSSQMVNGERSALAGDRKVYETNASSERTVLGEPSDLNADTAERAKSVRIPGYEVLGELGRGGMGVVYRARQVRLNRPCALKMILAGPHAKAESAARFLAEAEAIARLQHPHIVQIHHIGESDGLPFFELEYLPGGSLDQQLDGTPWVPRRAARLAEQLARGIAEAHRLGVVHRDLKPSNVLLAADGTPKISDFGLAKTLGSEAGLTRSEAIMGSPSYMSPEQAQGKTSAVGPAADIYALGVILYELLTGRPPFRGAAIWETLEQVKTVEPVPPSRLVPKLSRDLETICLKCLQKEPSRRYPTSADLAEDLRRFLDHHPVLARPVPAWERAARWARRRPVHATLAMVVALAVASLFGVGLWYNGRLRSALDATEAGRRETNLQKERAEANFRKARAAVDEMLTQVGQEDLADIPRMEPVRERLLGKALAFYQGFLRENGDDPGIRQEVARAYGRIAEIQSMLQHLPEAEAAYREAVALTSPPIARSPDADDRSDLAGYQGELGWLLMEAGRSREAADALDQSIELLERLTTEFPDIPAHEYQLARVQFARGRLFIGDFEVTASRRCYARSVALGEGLVARHPEVAKYRFELARGLASLGLLATEPGEWDRNFLKGIGLLETLVRDDHAVAKYRHQLGRILINRAALLLVRPDGTRDQAVPCLRRVISIFQGLVADFPDRPDYRHLLGMAHNDLGELLARSGDATAAERAFRASLELKSGLAIASPDVPDYRSAHGTGLAALGQHLVDHGRLDKGHRLLEEAIAEHRAALTKVPHNPLYRIEARKAADALGLILCRMGDHAGLARLAALIPPHQSGDPEHDHFAARVLARCVPLVLADRALSLESRHTMARQYADAAMVALGEAIRKGDRDFRHFQSDQDLAPLKGRDDFDRLLMDLAFPADTFVR